MRRLIAVAVAIAALTVVAPAQADYLISGPNYTTPSGRVCQVKVETYLYDQATYFFSLQVMEDVRSSCGYIGGTGFPYPPVWNHNTNPDGLGGFACAWSNTRSEPVAGYIINTYQKTVCAGAPATYRSRHYHGINLYGGARWNLGAGCHLLYASSGNMSARQICVNTDRTQMEVRHWNTVWVA